MMRRGDVVTVATNGDYGKPRPAVIVQTDALPQDHASVIVVQFTTRLSNAEFRVAVDPTDANGLRVPCQAMADKPVAVRRDRVGTVIGRLTRDDMSRITAALVFAIGAAD